MLSARSYVAVKPTLTGGWAQVAGALGGGPDGMEVDGAKRTLHVGTHALSHRRDNMEARRGQGISHSTRT